MSFLRDARTNAGKTLTILAADTSISESYLSQIETGKRRPSVSVAKRLGATLGVDWTKFFEEV